MWMRPLAIAVAAFFLALGLAGTLPPLAALLVLVAVAATLWSVALALGPKLPRKDAYDLGELRRVHEQEEIRAAHAEETYSELEQVVCARCFQEFPARLGACPRCGTSA